MWGWSMTKSSDIISDYNLLKKAELPDVSAFKKQAKDRKLSSEVGMKHGQALEELAQAVGLKSYGRVRYIYKQFGKAD